VISEQEACAHLPTAVSVLLPLYLISPVVGPFEVGLIAST
jgi:hypothetical protein